MQKHWYHPSMFLKLRRTFSSSFGIGLASVRLADRPVQPCGLSALTGVLLIWWGVRTRLSALHRLAGWSWPANHVTAGPVLQEKGGMGQESMCLLLMLCACQSRPFFSSRFLHFFSGAACDFPVVQFCLSQRCMTETDGWSSVSSL